MLIERILLRSNNDHNGLMVSCQPELRKKIFGGSAALCLLFCCLLLSVSRDYWIFETFGLDIPSLLGAGWPIRGAWTDFFPTISSKYYESYLTVAFFSVKWVANLTIWALILQRTYVKTGVLFSEKTSGYSFLSFIAAALFLFFLDDALSESRPGDWSTDSSLIRFLQRLALFLVGIAIFPLSRNTRDGSSNSEMYYFSGAFLVACYATAFLGTICFSPLMYAIEISGANSVFFEYLWRMIRNRIFDGSVEGNFFIAVFGLVLVASKFCKKRCSFSIRDWIAWVTISSLFLTGLNVTSIDNRWVRVQDLLCFIAFVCVYVTSSICLALCHRTSSSCQGAFRNDESVHLKTNPPSVNDSPP